MKFYQETEHGAYSHAMSKLLLVMKLIVFLLTVTILQVNAVSYAQKITLKTHNESLENVFSEIRNQSNYDFFYDLKLIRKAKPVTIEVKGASIGEVLNLCLKGQLLTYKVEDKVIMVREINQLSSGTSLIKTITGVVIDADSKQLLSGVSVKNLTTNVTVVSAGNGRYTIKANPDDVLVFSFVGYVGQQLKVLTSTTINVALKSNLISLNEVLVIGYGTVSRADLTGSVGVVNMNELTKAPVASFEQALAGRIAGVAVTSSEDQPGSGMNIVIRGAGSLTQSAAPLYVVNGFPIEDFDASSLNPEDIESISVLKDASATAIYGARGANGVIIVETKQGQEGLTVISYSGQYGIAQSNKRMEMMSPYEFVKYELERSPSQASERLFPELFAQNIVPTLADAERYRNAPSIDWQDKILQNGLTNIHSLSLRGGTKQTRYSISGSVFDQQGSIINSGSSRYSGNASLTQTVNSKLRAGANLNYSYNPVYGQLSSFGSTGAGSSSLFFSAWGYRPVSAGLDLDFEDDLFDPDIDQTTDYRINPFLSVQNELRERYTTNLQANGWFTYNFSKTLSLKVQGGIDSRLVKNKSFYNSLTHRGSESRPNNTAGVNGGVSYAERDIWSNENTLTWKKTLNKRNKIDAVGGFSLQSISGEGFGLSAQNLPNESLGVWGLNEGIPRPVSSSFTNSTLMSYFARVNYNYNEKYYATLTARADGSSKFVDHWGYFPSGAVSWRMSNEPFMKKVVFISDAKLRASFGITGNNRVGDFSYLSSLGLPLDGAYSFNNATPMLGVRQTSMGNEALKWESTAQTDFGLDLAFLKNRIQVTVDVYRKTTSDLLLNANLPFVTGFSSAFKNIGKLQNQGLEISLQTSNVNSRKFTWTSNFNISFNQNKILALADDEEFMLSSVSWDNQFTNFPYIARVGQAAANYFGMIWEGVYNYDDFDTTPGGGYILKGHLPTNNPDANRKPQPGDIKYRDINGDGIINDYDRVNIGRALPIHTGGFGNNFQYMGFDLNVFFQWSFGNDILNANKAFFEGNHRNMTLLNQFASYVDRWSPENPNSTLFRAGGGSTNGVYSSRLIEDGSFLRLKTVALSYTVPKQLSRKLSANTISLNASAQNLITWTNYSGMDPEVSVRNSILTPGLDWSSYPRMRTIVFGLKASF